MADKFKLTVLVPSGIKYEDEIGFLIIPGEAGEFSVTPNHIPMVTPVNIGEIALYEDYKHAKEPFKRLATSGGICRIERDSVTLILRTAEFADEIDIARAQESKERAEKRLSNVTDDIDPDRAKASLKRAYNRINVAGGYNEK